MLRTYSLRRTRIAAALAAAVAYGPTAHAQPSSAPAETPSENARVTPLLTMPLGGIPGKEGSMVTVEYPPGGASPPHRHNANVFVYVLEGAVVMQVEGGEEMTLAEGETFHELPSDIHTVSRNASDTEPAKILVFLVKDEGAPATEPLVSGARR
ncbi:MAG: cupin domain-containing protein [Gammaproteobacteria bacterium]